MLQASALGLGELRTVSALGERLRGEIDLQVSPGEIADAACFRLRIGDDDSLPWLRQATFAVRRGQRSLLEIRAATPLREPLLRVGVVVGCGHDLRRDYTVLVSPKQSEGLPSLPLRVEPSDAVAEAAEPAPKKPRRPRGAPEMPPPEHLAPVRPARRVPAAAMPDRLVLAGGGGEGVAEPSLRLATELLGWRESDSPALEAQRELLRLEFRTLRVLNEQADSQLAAAEKLRNLEATLGELQERSSDLTQRIEDRAAPPRLETAPAAVSATAVAQRAPVKVAATVGVSEWTFYGLLLGGLLGIGGWLGWRQWRERSQQVIEDTLGFPELVVDPQREDEHDEPGGVDLPVEPAQMGMPLEVDVDLGASPDLPAVAPPPAGSQDSSFSIAAATVHEHFEANPVMELAEIMLSFGRVKGAAQALQEFIDQSPDEALKPWIRLLDVYRMANMREEFERVAVNLNKHFNVEVLKWNEAGGPVKGYGVDLELVPREGVADDDSAMLKAPTIEELPHLCENLVAVWNKPECSDYLHWLLRDNRGGKRSGFALTVVNEILFLIELRETVAQMNSEESGK